MFPQARLGNVLAHEKRLYGHAVLFLQAGGDKVLPGLPAIAPDMALVGYDIAPGKLRRQILPFEEPAEIVFFLPGAHCGGVGGQQIPVGSRGPGTAAEIRVAAGNVNVCAVGQIDHAVARGENAGHALDDVVILPVFVFQNLFLVAPAQEGKSRVCRENGQQAGFQLHAGAVGP